MVIAVILGLLLSQAAPALVSAATLCGIAGGAFFAGKRAFQAGLYHGALVGVGYVVLEGIGLVPTLFQPLEGGIAESISIIAADALLLGLAALFGWIASPSARPSSSSETGKGR